MAKAGAYDQENVDRFVRRAHYRFRWVPAWESWFERRGDVWRSEGARAALRAAYYDSLAEYDPDERAGSGEVAGREAGTSAMAQKMALWLLEHDPRMWSSPEEFEIPGGRLLREPPVKMKSPWGDALDELARVLSFDSSVNLVHNWAVASRHENLVAGAPARVKKSFLVCRRGTHCQDLHAFDRLLEAIFGERLVSLGPKTWGEFPESLGAKLARDLSGAHCVFLAGWEQMRYFPETALVEWLRREEVEWRGWDGGVYRLALPRSFILGGRPLPKLGYVDMEIGDRILSAGMGG